MVSEPVKMYSRELDVFSIPQKIRIALQTSMFQQKDLKDEYWDWSNEYRI